MFDFSVYPKDSVYYDDSNKKGLGEIKHEMNWCKIVEFVGLKSKMYSLISCDGKEINKANGVNKKLRNDKYFDVLFNKKVGRHVLDDGINT